MRSNEHFVAVVCASGGPHRQDDLRARAGKVAYLPDGAIVTRLDRVVIELLLRHHLTSSDLREELVPRLLVRRVVLSWWRPSTLSAEPDMSWVPAADPAVLCAVAVSAEVKTWVMASLSGKELL
jgi:hypothetical protein